MKNMENGLQLANSLAEIRRLDQAEKDKKQNDLSAEQQALAPKARDKLVEKGGDVSKLTKKEIASILFVYYSVSVASGSLVKKPELVEKLKEAIEKSGAPLEASAVASSAVSNAQIGHESDSDASDNGHAQEMHFDEDYMWRLL